MSIIHVQSKCGIGYNRLHIFNIEKKSQQAINNINHIVFLETATSKTTDSILNWVSTVLKIVYIVHMYNVM
jgi:hypothetical protein